MNSSTVFVAAIEGRNFVKRNGTRTYIQCRFNQEVLTTDPVPLSASPIWDTELAWELEPKVLSFLRTQRVPIKVVCYSIDSANKRESLGYVILDLRTAPDRFPAPEKWYPLINTKFTTGPYRPEIKLGFAVGAKELLLAENTAPQPSSVPHPVASASKMLVDIPVSKTQFSVPIKLADDGYFQVGQGTEQFVLSLTISFAENLHLLLDPSKYKRTILNYRYFFYFSFLDDDVSTEPFTDLQPPNFPAEKLTIRFRASLRDLKTFLDEYGVVKVYLCQQALHKDVRRKVLGHVKIPLRPLIKSPTDTTPPIIVGEEEEEMPSIFEKNYVMYDFKDHLYTSMDGKTPSVGISTQVAREGEEKSIGNISVARSASPEPMEKSQEVAEMEDMKQILDFEVRGDVAPVTQDEAVKESLALDSVNKGEEEHLSLDSVNKQTEGTVKAVSAEPETKEERALDTVALQESVVTTQPLVLEPPIMPTLNVTSASTVFQDPSTTQEFRVKPLPDANTEEWHQYRFSVDLKCFREVRLRNANLFVRFLYRPFGTQSPFLTLPVPVSKSLTETQTFTIKNGFCANEFVMSVKQLAGFLHAVPLTMEVWHKDEYTNDVCVGNSEIWLNHVLEVKKAMYADEKSGKQTEIRTLQITAPVIGEQNVVCCLDVILALEDFGIIEERAEEEHEVTQEKPSVVRLDADVSFTAEPERIKVRSDDLVRQASDQVSVTESLHDTLEYKVVLDLELWKKQEQARFERELQEKEEHVMSQLAQVFKKRDADRQNELTSRMEELERVQLQVTKLTQALEERERQLLSNEVLLTRRKEDLDREYDKLVEDARDSSKRLQEEYAHKLKVEKQKTADLERMRTDLLREREELLARLKTQEEAFAEHKRNAVVVPEAQFKSDFARMEEEKARLEKKAETLAAAKKHYKLQWIKVLKEYAKLRKQVSSVAMTTSDLLPMDSLDDVAKMAQSEAREMKQDRQALASLANEFHELKASTLGVLSPEKSLSPIRKPIPQPPALFDMENLDPAKFEEVERLIKERDGLLSAGVYTHEDRLVRELNARIRELLSHQEG